MSASPDIVVTPQGVLFAREGSRLLFQLGAAVHGPGWAGATQLEARVPAGWPLVEGRTGAFRGILAVPRTDSTLTIVERLSVAAQRTDVSFELSADREAVVEGLQVSFWLPVAAAAGGVLSLDGKRELILPEETGAPTLALGSFRQARFEPKDGTPFSVELSAPSGFLVHDLRNWGDPRFELRIHCLQPADGGRLPAGQVCAKELALTFDRPLGSVALGVEGSVRDRPMEGWFQWEMPWDDDTETIVDVSGLLHRPAGKFGFLQVKDGHYAWGNGERQRFWGVNLSAGACFPPKEVAPAVARRLAKFGVNIVRPTIDTTFGWPTLVDMTSKGKVGLDPETLDRFDFFVNELKQNGIYLHLDLQWTRHWCAEDGFFGEEVRGKPGMYTGGNAPMYYNNRFWEVGTAWARNLLLHVNPFTGNRYVDEPSVAAVQIVNEAGIWNAGPGMPRPYLDELQAMWNAWLLKRYGSAEGLATAWGDGALAPDEDPAGGSVSVMVTEPARRDADRRRFLYEVERDYYARFYEFLRGLGVKCPITCTNGPVNLAQTYACSVGDAIEFNAYWDHPHREWRWYYNRAMVRELDGSSLVRQGAAASVAGKPFTYTEFNLCGLNEHRCEGPMLMAAYAALQDWDGLIWYTYAHPSEFWQVRSSANTAFDIHQAPQIIGQFPAAARAFLSGAIVPARSGIDVVISEEEAFMERGWTWAGWGPVTAGSPATLLPFLTKMRNRFEGAKSYTGDAPYALDSGRGGPPLEPGASSARVLGFSPSLQNADALRELLRAHAPEVASGMDSPRALLSDTGQVHWNGDEGWVTVSAPCVRAVVGFTGGKAFKLSGVRVRPETAFSSISLVSMDGLPLEESQRILVTAVARAANTGETWLEGPTGDEFRLEDEGRAPAVVEPVVAGISVPFTGARAFSLDPTGRRLAELPMEQWEGRAALQIGTDAASIWYEISR